MRKIYSILTLSLSLSLAGQAVAQNYDGSDTLEKIVEYVLDPGSIGATGWTGAQCGWPNLNYLAGGSSNGEKAMCGFGNPNADQPPNQQHTSPMSRSLGEGRVCDPAQCPQKDLSVPYESLKIGTDKIALIRNNDGAGTTCDLEFINDVTINNYSNGQATWTEAIQLIYAGVNGTGTEADCKAQVRLDLVNDWNALHTDDCPSGNCSELRHAFRRGDNSGTTDVFKDLVGITAFCNGSQQEDNDPVRRNCKSSERYCPNRPSTNVTLTDRDGNDYLVKGGGDYTGRNLGVVLAIDIPGGDADFIDAVNNNTNCDIGNFGYAQEPGFGARCKNNGALAQGGLCLFPKAGNDFGCNNGRNNRPAGSPFSFDGRTYNESTRTPAGVLTFGGKKDDQKWSEFYRLSVGCDEKNSSTLQIGCLVSKNNCTIGWAGKAILTQSDVQSNPDVQPYELDGCDINSLCGFPLARDLYFNAIDTFGDVVNESGPSASAYQLFAACMQDPSILSVVVPQAGFDYSGLRLEQGTCSDTCGDGIIEPLKGEVCDDGNTINGDGCSDQCLSETCGDGNLDIANGEECDDMNQINGDGCSSYCTNE